MRFFFYNFKLFFCTVFNRLKEFSRNWKFWVILLLIAGESSLYFLRPVIGDSLTICTAIIVLILIILLVVFFYSKETITAVDKVVYKKSVNSKLSVAKMTDRGGNPLYKALYIDGVLFKTINYDENGRRSLVTYFYPNGNPHYRREKCRLKSRTIRKITLFDVQSNVIA